MPSISVLMPARNSETYVGEAIESIIEQTFPDWELIIADDASTDGTRHIIDKYDDPRIRRIHNEQQLGVASTRNKLLRYAYGEFITWLDADDISYPLRLEKLLDAFSSHPHLALCGSNVKRRYVFSGEYFITNHPLGYNEIRSAITEKKRVPFTPASVAFRAGILKEVGNFREFFNMGGEDPDFILRVCEKYPVGNIPDALYEYRYTRGSVSRRFHENEYLRLYLPDLWFFLAEQRARHNGIDGLMEQGDKEAFESFIDGLRQDFETDRSILYRRACQNKIANQDYAFAFLDALKATKTKPLRIHNHFLFFRIASSLGKAVCRAIIRQLKRSKGHN